MTDCDASIPPLDGTKKIRECSKINPNSHLYDTIRYHEGENNREAFKKYMDASVNQRMMVVFYDDKGSMKYINAEYFFDFYLPTQEGFKERDKSLSWGLIDKQ